MIECPALIIPERPAIVRPVDFGLLKAMTFPFIIRASSPKSVQVPNPNAFTKIGDMTASGGLANAFDGVTVQTNANAAEKTANTGYVGLDFGAGNEKAIDKVIMYSASNTGFNGSGTATPAPTLNVRGSNSAVATPASDGTSLTSQVCNGVIADVVTGTNAVNRITKFRYVWLYISGGSSGAIDCAEMQIFELI